jgi:hypothetical protein
MQNELQSLTTKLNNALETRPAPPPPRPVARPRSTAQARRPARPAPEDPRWGQIRNQLANQQKEIASTREDLGKAREELHGELNSTRDNLSTSIAHNHDEVVTLQKRGERNYFEFQLDKSKQFRRVGPVSVSLRKANVKRKSFNLAMMIEDNQLEKKNVNLYEPVWINLAGDQLELVVNQIDKDRIQGYLSGPKYKKSELGESGPVVAKPAQLQPRL